MNIDKFGLRQDLEDEIADLKSQAHELRRKGIEMLHESNKLKELIELIEKRFR